MEYVVVKTDTSDAIYKIDPVSFSKTSSLMSNFNLNFLRQEKL